MNLQEIEKSQKDYCSEMNVSFVPPQEKSMAGFARSTVGKLQMNGLRHPPTPDTNGWFIWFGTEFSEDRNFFVPMHVEHIYDEHSQSIKLLGLPPGCRFLLAGDYLDVWYDESLLSV